MHEAKKVQTFDLKVPPSSSSSSSMDEETFAAYEEFYQDLDSRRTPAWEFYAAAAEEPVPTYR